MPALNILGEGLPLRNLIVNGSSEFWLLITVIHGYVQSADTVASNTRALKNKLSDIATLHYVDGPPMRNNSTSSSRPWWILGNNLEHNLSASARWDDTVCCCSFNDIIFDALRLIECNKVKWWSDELSKNEYDGVIGLSQGSAMTALLLSMVSTTLFLRYPAIPLWFGKQNCSPEF